MDISFSSRIVVFAAVLPIILRSNPLRIFPESLAALGAESFSGTLPPVLAAAVSDFPL
jgi:hypothetical protein